MDTITSSNDAPDMPNMTAKQAVEKAKKTALVEAYRLIDINITHGIVLTSPYPQYIRDHLRYWFHALGYTVEETAERLRLSWEP